MKTKIASLFILLSFLLIACNESTTSPEEENIPTNGLSTPEQKEPTSPPEEENTEPTSADEEEEANPEPSPPPTQPVDTTVEDTSSENEEPSDTTNTIETPDTLLIQDFGTGARSSSPHVPGLCYEDGTGLCNPSLTIDWQQYAIADPSTLPESYFNALSDHTGLTNGRVLAIDMGEFNGIVYSQTVNGATINSRYQVNMWVGNVTITEAIYPKLEIVILQDGQELMRVNTGDIPVDGTWHSYGGEFTAISNSDVEFRIENKKLHNNKNDPMIDDISIIEIQ